MSIKGLAYTKTPWAYEERPVASTKLNAWDDRIEAALELLAKLLNRAWGNRDGVLRESGAELQAIAATPLGRSVEVQPGYAFISGCPYALSAATQSTDVTPPLAFPRIDLLQAALETWNISIKTGAQAPTPTAPSPDPDCLPLAHLYLRPGMSTIKNSDDGTNGYIIDQRPFL